MIPWNGCYMFCSLSRLDHRIIAIIILPVGSRRATCSNVKTKWKLLQWVFRFQLFGFSLLQPPGGFPKHRHRTSERIWWGMQLELLSSHLVPQHTEKFIGLWPTHTVIYRCIIYILVGLRCRITPQIPSKLPKQKIHVPCCVCQQIAG